MSSLKRTRESTSETGFVEREQIVTRARARVRLMAGVLEGEVSKLRHVLARHVRLREAVRQTDPLPQRTEHGDTPARARLPAEQRRDLREPRAHDLRVELTNRRQAERVRESMVHVVLARERMRERVARAKPLLK